MDQSPPVSAYAGRPPATAVASVLNESADYAATLYAAPPGIPPPPAPGSAPHPAEPPAKRPGKRPAEENSLVIAQTPPPDRVPSDMSSASPDPPNLKRGRASRVMSSGQPRKRQRTEDKPLACPFYKRDPTQHRKCGRIRIKQISYVKQHLHRAHRKLPHCQICNELFQTDAQLREHIRSMTCERRPYDPPDGMTEEQIVLLQRRVSQKASLEDQWYDLFDIIFPGAPRPTSVYLDPETSEDLDDFVNFLTTDGPGIICGNNGAIQQPQLATALQKVVDQWRGRRTEMKASSLPKPETVERPRLPSTAVRADTSPHEPLENRVKSISSLIFHGSGETDA